jgi:hypothetical protein
MYFHVIALTHGVKNIFTLMRLIEFLASAVIYGYKNVFLVWILVSSTKVMMCSNSLFDFY